MGVFRQLGDPLAGAVCLCQHHQQAYAELETTGPQLAQNILYDQFVVGATILTVQITTTETCCVIVNAAMVGFIGDLPSEFEIERPLGTIRTQQEDVVPMVDLLLLHHASWEVLPPGTYTYYLVNRAAAVKFLAGAWIKAIASDCEG